MILLATNRRDLTTDYVVSELSGRGIPFVRFNTETAPSARVRFRAAAPGDWTLEVEGQRLALKDVSAAYYRRPGVPDSSGKVRGPGEAAYCDAEWSSVLRSIYTAIGARWLNSPAAISAAEDKPRQLHLAMSLGMAVPETLVTNDYGDASAFVASGPTIAKPLRESLIEGSEERIIFTSRVDALGPELAAAVGVAPLILQREIPKRCDIRATVVGARVLAAGIHSQEHVETEVDWRHGSRPDLRHEAHALPGPVAAACVAITSALGLRFSAIDLVLDRNGKYWFLEANPNGQWAWIQNRTGLPIARAIVDELELTASL